MRPALALLVALVVAPAAADTSGLAPEAHARRWLRQADAALEAGAHDEATNAVRAARCIAPAVVEGEELSDALRRLVDTTDDDGGAACPRVTWSREEGLASAGLTVRVLRDPLGLIGGVRFDGVETADTVVPLSRASPLAFVAAGASPAGELVLVSREGHEIRRLPVREPRWPWLTLAGAGGLGLGMAAFTASALGVVATYENPSLPEWLRPTLLAAGGLAAAVAVAGAVAAAFDPAQAAMSEEREQRVLAP